MPETKRRHEPIRQSVHVDCPVEDAFRLFTEDFPEWWPLATNAAGEESDTCGIEPWVGGRLFERTRSGEDIELGTVTAWDPPNLLEFTWNPASARDNAQSVSIEFSVEADGPRVTLIHQGWERTGVETCFAVFVSEKMLAAV